MPTSLSMLHDPHDRVTDWLGQVTEWAAREAPPGYTNNLPQEGAGDVGAIGAKEQGVVSPAVLR